MKIRSLFRRLADKLTGKKPAPPKAKRGEKPPPKRTDSSFEPLEGRIAPAVLLNATTVQFTDTDGDLVTVKFSKSFFSSNPLDRNGDLDAVFKFLDPANKVRTAADGGSATEVNQLAMLDLSALGSVNSSNPAAHTDITITAIQAGGGDGLVNVGFIKARGSAVTGISLGKVTVDGDLGRIEAGDATGATGIASLTVESIGKVGLTSQLADGTLNSSVTGALGKLVVKTNITDAVLRVVDGNSVKKNAGDVGSIFIGGNLQVSTATTAASVGLISVTGKIGSIDVGNIFGGAGDNSGQIKTSSTIGKVTIHGDIRGGAGKDSGEISGGSFSSIALNTLWAGTGENSGRINSGGSIGKLTALKIAGAATFDNGIAGVNSATISASGNVTTVTIMDGLYGGTEDESGSMAVAGKITTLTVGKLVGGDGANSGQLKAGALGTVTVTKSLQGGEGDESGALLSLGNWTKVTVNNTDSVTAALLGGEGFRSGSLTATGSLGTAIIKGAIDGSITDAAARSASISAGGNIGSITVSGFLKGGLGELTGSISAGGTIGTAKTGELFGAVGDYSASITAAGQISSVTVTGSLHGGGGASSASVVAGSDFSHPANLSKIVVTGKLLGNGIDSASIRAGGKIVSVTIGDKALSDQVVLMGGSGSNSASINGNTGIAKATIWGTVEGGVGANSGSLQATGLISTVKISGSLKGGGGSQSGSIQAHELLVGAKYTNGDLGAITITGGLVGAAGPGSGLIFADGSAKTITVGSMAGSTGLQSGSIRLGQGEAPLVNDYKTLGGAGSIIVKGAITGSATAGGIEALGRIGKLTTSGMVTGSTILTGRDFGTVSITGGMADANLIAQGSAKATAKADLAFGNLTIAGSVSGSKILAGYDRFGNATNGNAQIGTVKVMGDWMGSSLVAGVEDVDHDGFGDADDQVIGTGTISKIASITITGSVSATAAVGDQYGFVAQEIKAMKVGTEKKALTADKNTIPLADDTLIHEVP